MGDENGASRAHPPWVSFQVWGPNWAYPETGRNGILDPEDLTTVLGITPTQTRVKGDPVVNPNTGKVSRCERAGFWSLSSKGRVASDLFTDHLGWVLDQLNPVAHKLRRYVEEHNVSTQFYCVIWVPTRSQFGIVLPATMVERIARLGADFGLSIECLPEEED